MNKDKFNLERFVSAQVSAYQVALDELRNGCKHSHWMWYIFPQLKHLGRSPNAKLYGIDSIEEAVEYYQHPVLGIRLREVCEIIMSLDSEDAVEVFSSRIDARKLCSSMTLFDAVAPNGIYAEVLEKFFDGKRDKRTLSILNREAEDQVSV